jgi:tetratricopeptide (TPR) repeat protein
MLHSTTGTMKCVFILCVVTTVGIIQPASGAQPASIVFDDIEYTRDGRAEDEGRSAIQAYLEFFLSRLHYRKPQRFAEYIRDCKPKEADGSCPLPDVYIQLQIAERQGEVQISGAVGRKVDPKNWQPHNLDSIRVKFRDLADGLSRVAKDIDSIITKGAIPAERAHVVLACFGSSSDSRKAPQRRARRQTRDPAPVTAAAASYAGRLPKVLEVLLHDESRIKVSTSKDTRADCGSLEGLQAIARTASAEAVLSGTVFIDDRSGLMVLPRIFIVGAAKKIALPVLSIPSGADVAASYELVARSLAAVSYALLGSKRGELVKAVGEGTELSFYLDRANEYLSSSPPEYDAADAILELAKAKAPAGQQSYLLLASSLASRMRYTEAAATLRSGIDQVPDGEALYAALAENSIRAGDLAEARRVYEQALNANILGEDALLGIARTYLSDRAPEKAMEYTLKAVAQNPSSTDAYSLAGQIAEGGNDFETAEKYYQRARKLAPGSTQIASRLSSLYERRKSEDLRKGHIEHAIDNLTKSIEVSPSMKKYFDLAVVYLQFYSKSGQRSKGYELASANFTLALQIAREKNAVLSQFPWLMPNLVETLIFEGKFSEAKRVAEELFAALGSNTSIRPSIDPRDIRVIAAFLSATAQVLDAGSAEKELYLLENAALGMNFGQLPWSFSEMLTYLDEDYSKITPELQPSDRDARVAAVKQWIARLSGK